MSLRSPDDKRMLTRRSLVAVARAAALILASSALVATDLSLPSSKALRISSSYASVFGIGLTLAQTKHYDTTSTTLHDDLLALKPSPVVALAGREAGRRGLG